MSDITNHPPNNSVIPHFFFAIEDSQALSNPTSKKGIMDEEMDIDLCILEYKYPQLPPCASIFGDYQLEESNTIFQQKS